MPGLLLYSTNVFLKQHIQREYANDRHFVWCSECFDATTQPKYSGSALVGASSDPAAIYKDLKQAVLTSDKHNAKIIAQRASFSALAVKWRTAGQITEQQEEDIIWLVNHADFKEWRPLIYIIPRAPVEARLEAVPMAERASLGPEYIVRDLARADFDLIEL